MTNQLTASALGLLSPFFGMFNEVGASLVARCSTRRIETEKLRVDGPRQWGVLI